MYLKIRKRDYLIARVMRSILYGNNLREDSLMRGRERGIDIN